MAAIPKSTRTATFSATLTAVSVIGSQVAGKATRDAVFLSSWDITDLPVMLMAASVVSIIVVLVSSRLMVRLGPVRVVPPAFVLSSLTLLGIWGLMAVSRPIAAVALYLHLAAFGVILISGFWSMVNERFDPHTAKKTVSRIVAGATLGGLLGGVAAERFAASLDITLILPVLAGLHLFCAWKVRDLAAGKQIIPNEKRKETEQSALGILRRQTYLRNLGIIVLLGTVSAAILDYVYKDYATRRFTETQDLMRFFAIYYMSVGVLAFAVQTLFSRLSLQKLGLARTISFLPFATAAGSVGAFLAPGLLSSTSARLSEAVLRNSLFRSGYELFFIPVARKDKRATKTIIDVGFDRLGDTVGGGLIKLILLLAPLLALDILLVTAAVLSGLALMIAVFLKRGYVRALKESLLRSDSPEKKPVMGDASTSTMILQTLTNLDLRELSQFARPAVDRDETGEEVTDPEPVGSTVAMPGREDPVLQHVGELRSGDAERVKRALAGPAGSDPVLSAHILPLLAWDDVQTDAVEALKRMAPRVTGQLVDALLDTEEEFIIRRRIPQVMSVCRTQRAVDGLIEALSDRRFEVRFKAGKALVCICEATDGLSFGESSIQAVILSELRVDKHVWFDRRVLDKPGIGCQLKFFDEVIGGKAEFSLEHVFTLLSLILEPKPLRVAYRGLHTTDEMLRGTALEYLDAILPAEIRDAIWPILGDVKIKKTADRDRNKATQNLMMSSMMIDSNLAGLAEGRE